LRSLYARTKSARGEFEKEKGKREMKGEEENAACDGRELREERKKSGHCFATDTGG
jgi:hypothetical protein